MSTRDDGGPAFPVIGAPGAPEDYPGMSLRDYFAAHASFTYENAAQVAGYGNRLPENAMERDVVISVLALMNYEYADAMLKERAK